MGKLNNAPEEQIRLSVKSPSLIKARIRRAFALHQKGKVEEAMVLYEEVLHDDPSHFDARQLLASACYQMGRHAPALAHADSGLQLKASSQQLGRLHNLRGLALAALNRTQDAISAYDCAIALFPELPDSYNNRGLAYKNLEKKELAESDFLFALRLQPENVEALENLARLCLARGQQQEASDWYARLLSISSNQSRLWCTQGNLLANLKQHDGALHAFQQCLQLDPKNFSALIGLGNCLLATGKASEAIDCYNQAHSIHVFSSKPFYNRALAMKALGRTDEAFSDLDRTLKLQPDHAPALNNRAGLYLKQGDAAHAIADFQQAVRLSPESVTYASNLANAYLIAKNAHQALQWFERAFTINPLLPEVLGLISACRQQTAVWEGREALYDTILQRIQQGIVLPPFHLLGVSNDQALQLKCATDYTQHHLKTLPKSAATVSSRTIATRHAGKIRIAYLSSDFRAHAVMQVMAEVFELRDRAQFEIFAYDYGHYSQQHDAMRRRLHKAFDHFLSVASWTDDEIASHMQAQDIAIAVDLMGHTQGGRLGILAQHPVPVTVNYIGYPGTSGAAFMDYVIADSTLIPNEDKRFYSEQVVRLPDCYLPNDRKRRLLHDGATRSTHGLPESGFVFCAFSNTYKITPEVFAVWMRLLIQVDNSVLWLVDDNPEATANLRRYATEHGVDATRLVFAQRCGYSQYLARFCLADLFLDTLPYNALATASDALWAGLPVLTCTGSTYVGRGASSIVRAAGLPELATPSLQAYESRALMLATQPQQLQDLRLRLVQRRATCALFDSTRYVRHLESAYLRMFERAAAKQSPESFDITPSQTILLRRPTLTARQWVVRAHAHHLAERFTNAEALYHKALELEPCNFDATNMLGTLYMQQGKHAQALEWLNRALVLDNSKASTYNNRAITLRKLNRLDEALQDYDKALALHPDDKDILGNRLNALMKLHRYADACEAAYTLLAKDPEAPDIAGILLFCLAQIQDWKGHAERLQPMLKAIAEGKRVCRPFPLLSATDDPAIQRKCSENTSAHEINPLAVADVPADRLHPPGNRLRIAYLSADFSSHAVMRVLARVFELHDRSRFEVHAYNYGRLHQDKMARRLRRAFEHFHEVAALSDVQIVAHLRSQQIDIVIDLMGYTEGVRSGIFAQRPAAVCVNYIGYPGTMGSPCHDYVIGDPILIPDELRHHYSEQVVRLPDCYLPHDGRNRASAPPTRTSCGLPEQGFVFCAFSNNYKITEAVFLVWLDLLKRVPDSVLWLVDGPAEMKANLTKACLSSDIDPARLIYASRAGYSSYLARYTIADVFLDTFPYNALATASDALWMGLPVVTRCGHTYVSRGASSLLHAVGMPELVCHSLQDYAACAEELANNPDLLHSYKLRLLHARSESKLFDTALYTRHLEEAYRRMHARALTGLPAQAFDVR